LEHRVLEGEFLRKLNLVPIVSEDFLDAVGGEEGSMRILSLLKNKPQLFEVCRRLKAGQRRIGHLSLFLDVGALRPPVHDVAESLVLDLCSLELLLGGRIL